MKLNNRQRAKLTLDELEKEVEILTKEEMNACKGGEMLSGYTGGIVQIGSGIIIGDVIIPYDYGGSNSTGNGWLGGSGTENDPYLLSEVVVTANRGGGGGDSREGGSSNFGGSVYYTGGGSSFSSYGSVYGPNPNMGGGYGGGGRQSLPNRTTQYKEGEMRSPDTIMFFSKAEAYSHAVAESLDDRGIFIQFDNKIGKEVSGFVLENGSYIVLDPFDNKYDKSHNDQLKTFHRQGKWFVEYDGQEYAIKSHFHTHPPKSYSETDGIGVSDADLSMLKQLKVNSIFILCNGEEYEVSLGGNYTSKSGVRYSVKKVGRW